MIHLFHGNTNQPILNIPYAHTIEDVKRHTTVDMLLKAVRINLLYHCQHARCDAPAQKDYIDRAISVLLDSQPLQLAIQDGSGLIIPFYYTAATTVEEIDLFHQRARIVITNLPKDTLASSVYFASQGLGNARPAAQEHGSLLNHLLDVDHTKHDSATHPNELSTRDWNKNCVFCAENQIRYRPAYASTAVQLSIPLLYIHSAFKDVRLDQIAAHGAFTNHSSVSLLNIMTYR